MKSKFIIAVAVLFSLQATAQFNTFRGTGFEINYPATFKVHGAPGSLEMNLESVFFTSPDNLVEFYIFSPLHYGIASDIALKSNEKQSAIQTTNGKTTNAKFWTITAKDNSYERTYQESIDVKTGDNWVIGLKYKNQAAFAKYRNEYLAFKKSYHKTANTVSNSNLNNTINAKFSFEELAEDAVGMSKTLVYIEYNNNKIRLDTIYGTAYSIEKSNYVTRKIPKTAIEACGAWYGGGGTYFYMIQKGTKLQIYRAYADEEAPQSAWEKIKEF